MKNLILILTTLFFVHTFLMGQAHYEVESNSSSSAPQLLLKETEASDFVRLWFQNNETDKWAFNAKPKAGSFDAANILPSPIIFAYNGVQIFGIGSNGKVRINKSYTLPNVDGSAGQVLSTNGSGVTSWLTPSSSGTPIWQSNNSDIHYSAGDVGIGTNSPAVKLEIAGAMKVGYENPNNPEEGTIRWNTTTKDFEGYDGSQWRSLMTCSVTGSSNAGIPDVTPMCCEEYHVSSNIASYESAFGRSVAIYGNYAVIAAGGVGWSIYIFEYDGTNWSELMRSYGSESSFGNSFGSSIAIHEDWIAVGSHGKDDGKVYMFKNDNGVWSENTIIEPSDLTSEAEFGYAVSMSGDYMAISAPNTEIVNIFGGDPFTKQGKVYLYQNINDVWTEIGQFKSNLSNSESYFGTALSLSEQHLAIGSEMKSNYSDISEGKVFMYRKVNNTWGFETVLGSSYDLGDQFGSSIAIDNNTLIIGAIGDSVGNTASAGSVYIYEDINNDWSIVDTLISNNASPFERFGSALDIKGDYILVGKRGDVGAVDNAGAVDVFHYNNDWIYNRTISDQLPEGGAQFGHNFSEYNYRVATDGVNILIGAPFADANGYSSSGKVVFGPVD